MGDASINGYPLMRGRITRPRFGNWVAELVVDSEVADELAQGSSAQLSTDGGALSFKGTILPGRSDAYARNVTLRMVGGANGLAKLVTPRFYANVQAQKPVVDVLVDAGEVLSGASVSADLAAQLRFWSMVQQPASQALSMLAAAAGPGAVWRVQPDGSIFFGTDTFAVSALTEFDLIDYLPLEAIQVIASNDPQVHPGQTFNGRHVSVVEHLIAPEATRVRVWFEQ